ncbi:MAG: phosphodiester glycosidase family protein [Clostridia bacterium]|nr:phosphodiester glycosidase family protein [Clostridia bacterium]
MSGKKRLSWGLVYSILLVLFTAFVLLDTFVIPRTYSVVVDSAADTSVSSDVASIASETDSGSSETDTSDIAVDSTGITVTDSTYDDGSISITITEYREYDTSIYVADVVLSNPSYLQTAFASNTYGRNVTEKTSVISEETGAILAINGDYYGAQQRGYVIRNGVIYRETVSDASQELLVIYADGSFGIVAEGDLTAAELLQDGAVQVLSFGPGLVEDGEIVVTQNEEVDKAKTSNPRTAIGVIDDLHYVFVVADGRTNDSEGLTLYQLAAFMKDLGAVTAYNLDGGGSSTMVFNGTVVNNPTTNGKTITERSVSDIVYIGY